MLSSIACEPSIVSQTVNEKEVVSTESEYCQQSTSSQKRSRFVQPADSNGHSQTPETPDLAILARKRNSEESRESMESMSSMILGSASSYSVVNAFHSGDPESTLNFDNRQPLVKWHMNMFYKGRGPGCRAPDGDFHDSPIAGQGKDRAEPPEKA